MRRTTTILILALVLAASGHPVAAQVQSRGQRACLGAMTRNLRKVLRAEQRQVEHCVRAAGTERLPVGQTVEQCVTVVDRGRVRRAIDRLAGSEAARCVQSPDFGYVPGAAASAARGAALALAHDVLGPTLDAAVTTDAAGAACQRRVLAAAGRCADAMVREYGRCKRAAVDGGATGASTLVACKGFDPRRLIQEACRARPADVAAIECAGVGVDARFPGCASLPLADCVAAHALARPSQALDAADGLCGPLGPPAPAPEPIAMSTVPVPASVTEVQLPWWTVDGGRLVFSARITGFDDLQIARIAPDGSDFACLTCALAMPGDPPLMKPFPFPDGRRILVRIGNQTPFTNGVHGVLECAPSVLDCQMAALVPIEIPASGDANLVQPQREFRVGPDDEHVAFTQVRNDADGNPQFVSIVGLLDRLTDRYEIRDARVVSPLGELKQFAPDDQSVYVAAFVSNPFGAVDADAIEIDLAGGAVASRVTKHPAYDEPVEFSPDGAWFVVGSGRGAGLSETFSQVVRPSMITQAIGNVVFFYFLTQRPAMLEPWLLDRHGARDDYIGQPLKPLGIGDGWDGLMIPNWHPDGTRLVWWERALSPTVLAPGERSTRIRVARLTTRAPVTSPIAPAPMPSLAWAPPLAGYVPPLPPTPVSLDGAFSGRAEVVFIPGATNHLAITYVGYSDDGRRYLDGTEVADFTPGILGAATYDADVTQHGCRQGFLRAESVGISIAQLTGTTTSAVDGRLLTAP
jgi:hypothetical protein